VEYVKLGRTGLEVSRICLGCMSYGVSDRGNHAWSIDEAESRPFIKRALEGGINFFDTANRYSLGSSEEILGRAIKDFARRDEVVIATKVYGRMRPGPNGAGLSRKAIMAEIDASLRRLGTDYVDLYQIHRWDYGTPIEETLEALCGYWRERAVFAPDPRLRTAARWPGAAAELALYSTTRPAIYRAAIARRPS
jgi:aryl-alcohol dehydrogenase-like predicted oxidoreductase